MRMIIWHSAEKILEREISVLEAKLKSAQRKKNKKACKMLKAKIENKYAELTKIIP